MEKDWVIAPITPLPPVISDLRLRPLKGAWSMQALTILVSGRYLPKLHLQDKHRLIGAALGHGNYDDHTKDLREPIDLSQSDASTWYNRGVTLQELGQTAEAQAAFDRAREIGYKG
jgi:Flp pilus assembly protein TadD